MSGHHGMEVAEIPGPDVRLAEIGFGHGDRARRFSRGDRSAGLIEEYVGVLELEFRSRPSNADHLQV
jgi:hypothetical protein